MKKKILVILGMHRSGTSLLSRSTKCLGFDYGKDLHPPDFDNEKGFFEDTDIIKLNQKILQKIKFNWDSPQIVNEEQLKIINKIFFNEARNLIILKINNGVTSFKDPRITKLIKFWEPVFSSLEINVYYILTIRNPVSVARSLKKRNDLSYDHSALMWTEYNLNVLQTINRKKLCIINYEFFLKSPLKVLEKISNFCGQEIDNVELKEFTHHFLDADLNHSLNEILDLKKNLYFDLSGEVYTFLIKYIDDKNKITDLKINSWKRRFQEQTLFLNAIEKHIRFDLENKITNLNDHLEILIEKNRNLEEEINKSLLSKLKLFLILLFTLLKKIQKKIFR